MLLRRLLCILPIAVLLIGCGDAATAVSTPGAIGSIRDVEIKGQRIVERTESYMVEHCNIDIDEPIQKSVCLSTWNEEAIAWQWNNEFGYGGHIDIEGDGGVLSAGGGIDIGWALSEAYGGQRNQGIGQEISIPLTALRGQRMVYMVRWIITEETGVIVIEGREKPIRVQYAWPSAVDGNIISGVSYRCDETLPPTPSPIETEVSQVPVAIVPTSAPPVRASEEVVTTAAVQPTYSQAVPTLAAQAPVLPEFQAPFGRGILIRPINIALDLNGSIYVNDSGAKKIFVFSPEGDYQYALDLSMEVQDIALTSDPYLIVSSATTLETRDLDGRLIFSLPLPNDWNHQARHGLVVAPNGNIFVSDDLSHHVFAFSQLGDLLGNWTCDAADLAVINENNVWAVGNDAQINVFSILDASPPVLPGPVGLVESNQIGQAAVVDQSRQSVRYYSYTDRQWSLMSEQAIPGAYILDIALSNSDRAYILDQKSGLIFSVIFP